MLTEFDSLLKLIYTNLIEIIFTKTVIQFKGLKKLKLKLKYILIFKLYALLYIYNCKALRTHLLKKKKVKLLNLFLCL